MLDFRMDTFISVCKHMNFTKAAKELNITQPAVSQHIHYLEEYYQAKLFFYTGKRLSLSNAGKMLYEAVLTLKHDEIHLRDKIKEEKNKKKDLILGVTLTIGEFVIPKRVAAYMRNNPDVSVHIVVANTLELLNKIADGEIDFAIVEGYFEKNEYDYLVYEKENYIGVCGRDYPIDKSSVSLEELLKETVILRETGSGTREILEKTLEEKNWTVNNFSKIIEISSIHAIKKLVVENCGITFLYEVAVKDELERGILKKIPIQEFDIAHEFNFIWRKNSIFAEDYKNLFAELKG